MSDPKGHPEMTPEQEADFFRAQMASTERGMAANARMRKRVEMERNDYRETARRLRVSVVKLRERNSVMRDALRACIELMGRCAGRRDFQSLEKVYSELSDNELGRLWVTVGQQAEAALSGRRADAAKEGR